MVNKIRKNKNRTRLDMNSKNSMINNESKNSTIDPTNKSPALLSNRLVEPLKELSETSFKFQRNDCIIINIIMFMINKAYIVFPVSLAPSFIYIINKVKIVAVKKTEEPGETTKLLVIKTGKALDRNTCINWNNTMQANNTPIPKLLQKMK